VVDPPRTGLYQVLLKTIELFCTPSTLVKDIAVLDTQYNVEYMQPVNMFLRKAC
jgi:23S rRNA (uracil1939-C5)-methyltransferase